ncbi:MAG: PH domain-containing protein [Firmicutes bacterium]|nr:PH domain-containing protein [Bacillota bacterium]
MGIFRGIMGHASEMDLEKIEKDFELILIEGEEIEKAYKVLRDLFVFTNKRLILLDKQGMTGKKSEYRSIPYRSITYFSVESAGHFDLDAELKIYVRGMNVPIQKEFKKDKNIYDVQKALANYVL